jgi:hypothetical protein
MLVLYSVATARGLHAAAAGSPPSILVTRRDGDAYRAARGRRPKPSTRATPNVIAKASTATSPSVQTAMRSTTTVVSWNRAEGWRCTGGTRWSASRRSTNAASGPFCLAAT